MSIAIIVVPIALLLITFTLYSVDTGASINISDDAVIFSKETFIAIVVSLFAVLTITSVGITIWYKISVFKPLSRLDEAIKQIEVGDLDTPLERESGELGNLFDDFENMRLTLNDSIDTLIEYDRFGRELVSNISHDLRTPITSIKGYVEGIMDNVADTPEKMERYIRTIYNKTNDMDKLINDFVKAADVALDNLIPVAERALEGLMELGIKMLPEAVELGERIAKAIAKGVIKALLTPLSMLVKAIGGIFGLDAYGMKLDDQINQAGAYAEMAARASGGWINSGKTYLVGEKGPELITADRTMYVHNADETAKMLGGGRDIVINIAGDVYDDQYSMRKKIKGAVMSVLQEQMAYG